MGEVSALFGKSKPLEYKGKLYTIEPFTVEQLAEFEVWIEGQLWAAHKRSQRHLSDEEYKANGSALVTRIGMGEWSYPQPAFFQAMMTLQGCQRATFMALQKNHPEVDEELADEIVAARLNDCVASILQTDNQPDPPTTGGQTTPQEQATPEASST